MPAKRCDDCEYFHRDTNNPTGPGRCCRAIEAASDAVQASGQHTQEIYHRTLPSSKACDLFEART
jgi:hypothetical protein